MASSSDIDTSATSSPQTATNNHPYSYSIASSASSSSSSVFSVDASLSSQSSATPSSTSSLLNATWGSDIENEGSYTHGRQFSPDSVQVSSIKSASLKSGLACNISSETKSSHAAVALESRQHPRRTQRLFEADIGNGSCTAFHVRPPPALVRQCERKGNFVDSLVGKLTYST